jgi:ubiquinone/menaquinone biosynthesis C-methylase UbiE
MDNKRDTENLVTQRNYDQWHEKMGRAEAENPLVDPWYKSVFSALEPDVAGRMLEVGCGRGGFAVWLAKQRPNLQIIGLDFSETAIALARNRAGIEQGGVKFIRGDAQALPFDKENFEIVISCECMEHVPDPPLMAREIARVLKPGGRFILTTENYLNGMSLAWLMSWLRGRPFNSGAGVQARENYFIFWMVRSYLTKAGLVVDYTKASHYQWLLLPRVSPSRLCTEQFRSRCASSLAKPFGRHFTFVGHKPVTKRELAE